MPELAKAYDPKQVEDRIYRRWERSGFFNPDQLPGNRAKPFTIIMPPPNANGPLHIGHAVFVTLQDIMIRFQRMRGRKALWLPGADHAGFETQVVFDKKLEKAGRSRSEVPRDQLYQEMLKFTLENKKVMEGQLRKLGASADWSREKFTLDPDIVKIITDTFVKLYEDGLLYRGERIVNWCVKHQTTLSDLEIKYEERQDPLYYIKYGPLTLATVRPETKFGDTALAVHSSDQRYQKYVGKEIEIETLIDPVKIKIIADSAVDPEFGTGVIKVTPAHDPDDFEIGRRHNLEVRQVIGKDGRLNEKTGPYAGLKVVEARKKVAEDMEKRGLLVKTDPYYTHNVAVCYKCGELVEPLVMPQWFIAMTKPLRSQNPKSKTQKLGMSLCDMAVEAVKSGKIKFIPKRFEKVFFHWMRNLRDWNISRQIVWGIRIPAWFRLIPPSEGRTWDLKLYHSDSFEAIRDGRKSVETRAGKPPGAEKDWRQFRLGDRIRFTLVDPTDERPLTEPVVRRIRAIQAFRSLEELVRTVPLEQILPGGTFREYGKRMQSYLGFPERLRKYGVWAFELVGPDEAVEEIFVGPGAPPGQGWVQDPDVLDTWFSSGQWPFATLSYPNGRDCKTFYPTDVMETGYDILFFWVARMIMLGLYRTGKIPFRTVYLHGLVRDKDRQKMSKSKGNVIDPLGVAELYGTDAVRMALVVGNTAGNDIIISEEKIRGYRNFTNKLWNIHRFIMMRYDPKLVRVPPKPVAGDRRRRAELKTLVRRVTADLERFRFHHAAEAIYHYTWHTFADKIIEAQKPRLASADSKERTRAQSLLIEIHSTLLKLLHPFMPFITEELWQDLQATKAAKATKGTKGLLMVEEWPV